MIILRSDPHQPLRIWPCSKKTSPCLHRTSNHWENVLFSGPECNIFLLYSFQVVTRCGVLQSVLVWIQSVHSFNEMIHWPIVLLGIHVSEVVSHQDYHVFLWRVSKFCIYDILGKFFGFVICIVSCFHFWSRNLEFIFFEIKILRCTIMIS